MSTKFRAAVKSTLNLLKVELTWTAIGVMVAFFVLLMQYYDRQIPPKLSYFVIRTKELADTSDEAITRMTVGIENHSRVPARNVDIAVRSNRELKIYSLHSTRRSSDDVHTIITLETVPANTTAYVEVAGSLNHGEALDLRILRHRPEHIREADQRRSLHPLATGVQDSGDSDESIAVAGVHFDFGSVGKDSSRSYDVLDPISSRADGVSSR